MAPTAARSCEPVLFVLVHLLVGIDALIVPPLSAGRPGTPACRRPRSHASDIPQCVSGTWSSSSARNFSCGIVFKVFNTKVK